MDALILSCGTGGGHNSACMAIAEEMSARGHNAKILNPYLLKDDKTADIVNNAYISLAQKAPSAFGVVYSLGNAYRKLPVSSPVYHVNRRMAPLLEKYLGENKFDVIASTHLFPAEMLTNLKQRGAVLPKTYFIATDYTCIPFTEETDCDYYVIPAKKLENEFISRGIPKERILPFGIPVGKRFREHIGRDEARTRLGLDLTAKYILIAGGSIGAGQIEQIVPLLLEHYEKPVHIIVVCGNNHALYLRLEQNYGKRCTLLEYTDDMAIYMQACDLFLSKPGGLSSTEAAVVGTPLIHITPIPGCETRNMLFFEENGMSCAVRNPKSQLITACDSLLNEGRQREIINNQKKIISPNSAADICDFMENDNIDDFQTN